MDRYSLLNAENPSKDPIGPIISNPVPTLFNIAATVEKIVKRSIFSNERTTVLNEKMKMYRYKKEVMPVTLSIGTGLS